MALFPPIGFDRADGLDGRAGTPTPAGVELIRPASAAQNGFFEELSDSPTMEFAEQATFVHKYKCSPDYYVGITQGIHRGTIVADSFGYFYYVLSVSGEYQKGDFWLVTITMEAISFNAPPDEFSIEPVEFNPSLFLHPRYKPVVQFDPSQDDIDNEGALTGPQIIGVINAAVNLPQISTKNQNFLQLNLTTIPDRDVLKLAKELVTKLQKGEDTYYLAGFKIQWSEYFYLPPNVDPGGYIQDPVLDSESGQPGPLPFYFWSNDLSGDADSNIFTNLPKDVNPEIYGDGFSWLRQADEITFQRTWFKVTHSWVGGPNGQWDTDIYPTYPREDTLS